MSEVQCGQHSRPVILLKQLIFDTQRVYHLSLALGLGLFRPPFLAAYRRLYLKPALRQHRPILIAAVIGAPDRRALLDPLLKDLREIRLSVHFLGRWLARCHRYLRLMSLLLLLFDSEQILTERVDSVLATFKAVDFGDVAELAAAPSVLVVLDVLVRVDGLDQLLVLVVVVLKLVIDVAYFLSCCWVEG